jgi:hypothetical protein
MEITSFNIPNGISGPAHEILLKIITEFSCVQDFKNVFLEHSPYLSFSLLVSRYFIRPKYFYRTANYQTPAVTSCHLSFFFIFGHISERFK